MLPVSVQFIVMNAFNGAINLNRHLLDSSSTLNANFIEGLVQSLMIQNYHLVGNRVCSFNEVFSNSGFR